MRDWVALGAGLRRALPTTARVAWRPFRAPFLFRVHSSRAGGNGVSPATSGLFCIQTLNEALQRQHKRTVATLLKQYSAERPCLRPHEHTKVLMAYRLCGMGDMVGTHLDRIRDEGAGPNMYHYSIALQTYKWTGVTEKIMPLLSQMQMVDNVQPNHSMYATAISAFGLSQKWRERGTQIDGNGDEIEAWQQAYELFMMMPSIMGCAHTDETYVAILRTLGKARQTDLAFSLFTAMEEDSGVAPSPLSYAAIISALQLGEQYDTAEQVYAEMLARHAEGESHERDYEPAHNAMISLFGASGQWEKALEVFENALSSPPSRQSYTTILNCLYESKQLAVARGIFDGMDEWTRTNRFVLNMMQAYYNAVDFEKVVDVYMTYVLDTESNGLGKGASAKQLQLAKLFLKALSRFEDGKKGYDIFLQIPPLQRTPDMTCTMIRMLGQGGQWEIALDLLYEERARAKRNLNRRMTRKYAPSTADVSVYHAAIEACGNSKEWLMAYNTFLEMRGDKLHTRNQRTYFTLLDAMTKCLDDAAELERKEIELMMDKTFASGVESNSIPLWTKSKWPRRKGRRHGRMNRHTPYAAVNFRSYRSQAIAALGVQYLLQSREKWPAQMKGKPLVVFLPHAQEAGNVDTSKSSKSCVGGRAALAAETIKEYMFASHNQVAVTEGTCDANKLLLRWK